MKDRLSKILILPAGLSLLFTSAYACGSCSNALAWRAYPPIIPIMWSGVVWYIILCLISFTFDKKIRFIASIITTPILITVAYFLNIAMFGMIIFIPFMLFAIIGSFKYLNPKSLLSKSKADMFISISSYMIIGFIVFTIINEKINPTPRRPADCILKWEGTVLERRSFSRLQKAEPQSLEDYRTIVKNAHFYAVSEAAKRLAVIGSPETDVPLLIEAMNRIREQKNKDGKYVPGEIEETLKTMTGLDLPRDTGADIWLKKWNEKRAGKQSSSSD